MYLAALHYNENGDKQQATKKDGSLQWALARPKSQKGAGVVKVKNTYGNKHLM
jgi:hypothetical protein